MSTITHVSRKELSAVEVLDIVDEGGRVVIEMSVLGKTTKVVIRHRDGIYYCDTPMKLLKHETRQDLQNCLERYRLVRTQADQDSDVSAVSA